MNESLRLYPKMRSTIKAYTTKYALLSLLQSAWGRMNVVFKKNLVLRELTIQLHPPTHELYVANLAIVYEDLQIILPIYKCHLGGGSSR